MTIRGDKKYAEKHGPDKKPDSLIKDKIIRRSKNSELTCVVAFEIAKELRVSPDAVGITADLLNFKLVKCQLGLFGHPSHKKNIQPQNMLNQDLIDAIVNALDKGRLPCKSAWDIASGFEVHKMKVIGACEAIGVKITNCQLGAF